MPETWPVGSNPTLSAKKKLWNAPSVHEIGMRYCSVPSQSFIYIQLIILVRVQDEVVEKSLRRIILGKPRLTMESLYVLFCGYSTTVSVGDFQSSDEGSIPFTRSEQTIP